jgi:hypothetical protein
MIKNSSVVLLALSLVISGCASIVDSGDKSVRISSNPVGAKVSIYDKRDNLVIVQTTPTIVTLKRHREFFVPENYKIICELPNHNKEETSVKSVVNPWYLGNVVFGGLIGILIVDPATGAMWVLDKNEINFELEGIHAREKYSEQLKQSLLPK